MSGRIPNLEQVRASAKLGARQDLAWKLHQFWRPEQNPSYIIHWPPGRTHAQAVGDKLRWRQGARFEPLFLPTRIEFETPKVRLLDFHCISGPELNCVSEKVRQLVESREPGVHQFFPIEIRLPAGQPSPLTHFLLNICHKITLTKTEVFVEEVGMKAKLDTFARGSLAGMHIWLSRLPGTGIDCPFVSDDLKNAIENAGCSNLEFTPYRVVDG